MDIFTRSFNGVGSLKMIRRYWRQAGWDTLKCYGKGELRQRLRRNTNLVSPCTHPLPFSIILRAKAAPSPFPKADPCEVGKRRWSMVG